MAICTIQVTNICPKATQRQMKELFSYFGEIDEIRLFPEDDNKPDIPSKVCFVAYKERDSVEASLHLSNTVFIDRSLIIAQSRFEIIPEEGVAMSLAAPAVAVAFIDKNSLAGSGVSSTPLLPTPQTSLLGTPTMLPNPLASAFQQAQAVASSITANIQSQDDIMVPGGVTGSPLIPSTPAITGNVDPSKVDEIRRTIYVGNLSSTLHADQVMNFFQTCGEIRYVRMAGDETQPTRFAFVEFTNPESVQVALQYNGAMFGERPIKVNHSKNAIVKPQGKAPDVAQREVDEAMRKVRQANDSITHKIEPGSKEDKRSRSKTRSKSPRDRRREKRRHRSPTPPRDRRKRRSYSRSPPRRTSYRRGRRSRSRTPPSRPYFSHHRSNYHRYNRSPDRDGYRDSYKDRGRDNRDSYRDRDRDRDKRRYSRSRSRSKSASPTRHRSSRGSRKERGKERDHSPSLSPSPERKKSKKSKKEKKHRKKSPSLSPSPSPKKKEASPEASHEEEEEESMSDEDEGNSTPPSGSE